jgi:hypothetical protein
MCVDIIVFDGGLILNRDDAAIVHWQVITVVLRTDVRFSLLSDRNSSEQLNLGSILRT